MRVIGLTGGIASGKSTVSRILRDLGAPVIDADAIVHELQGPGTPVTAAIAREFGPALLRPDGTLDRAALGQVIFADPERRRRLEAIVHPAVRQRMDEELERCRREGRPAAVLDVPLLIEGELYRTVDEVWLVYVDRETERSRLMNRNGYTAEEADRRIAAQMDLDAKRSYAHVILDNRGGLSELESQVRVAWERAVAAGGAP